MNWDIDLLQNDTVVQVDPFVSNLNKPLADASLCIDSQIGRCLSAAMIKVAGMHWLDGKSGEETVPQMTAAIGRLVRKNKLSLGGHLRVAAPEHTKDLLLILCAWAEQHPGAIWRVAAADEAFVA